MSAATFRDRARETFDTASARLPDDVVPASERRAAIARLLDLGLPGLRDDAWRYSNLRPLQGAGLAPSMGAATPHGVEDELDAPLADATRLVFVDGRLDAGRSTAPGARGGLTPLPAYIGGARSGETRFALLNDAFAVDAARYSVAGECRLELVFVASAPGVASYPRVELVLQPGAQLTLVERHVGSGSADGLSSAVADLRLGRDATCRWSRLQDLPTSATHLDAVHARLEAGASLELVQLQLGGGSVRSTFGFDLAGRGARTRVQIASIAGEQRTHDNAILVQHVAPDTQSHQELRAIATGRASIAFQSTVSMGAEAAGADSRQSLKGLVGGDGAEVNLRPQLEIDVDSVRASHGATTGAIDEGMLFYLLSRGLDRETARQLLEWAFIETVIGGIAEAPVRREFERRTVARLGNLAAREVIA